ncbi:MAG: AraC family transcriptional regulator [Pyrinomonadaceae bacterium]
MDIIRDILTVLRLRGNLYFRTDLREPWGIFVPTEGNIARFHVVISGSCWMAVEGFEPFRVSEGDLVIVPHGSAHRLMDDPGRPCRDLPEVLEEQEFTGNGILRYGGSGATTSLVCGYFSFDGDVIHPLIESLPNKLHIEGRDNLNFLWLDTVMKFIGIEAETNSLGSLAIIERLSEILFIQVIRAYSTIANDSTGYLAALGHDQIGRVLAQIHKEPNEKWTLEKLARLAGSSRTAFTEQFHSMMGMPPIEYLTRWRMIVARSRLIETKKPIAEIAEDVGYQSEASFRTAFKRVFGTSPGFYRSSEA